MLQPGNVCFFYLMLGKVAEDISSDYQDAGAMAAIRIDTHYSVDRSHLLG